MTTIPAMVGNVREYNMPKQPTPRRATLESVRNNMQVIIFMSLPVGKNTCCVSLCTPRRNVKYLGNIHKNSPPRGHTKHPTQLALTSTEKLLSLNWSYSRLTSYPRRLSPLSCKNLKRILKHVTVILKCIIWRVWTQLRNLLPKYRCIIKLIG